MALTRWLAALFAALLLFTGCGIDDGSDDNSDDTGSSESAGETSEEPETEESEAAAELPDGYKWVTAEASGVKFGVPKDWQIVDSDFLDNPGSQAQIEEYAKRSGISVEQWQQQIAMMDVMVINASRENVNVMPPGTVPSMPSEETIRADFGSLGATVSAVRDLDTPIGQGRAAFYSLPGQGANLYGTGVFIETDNGIVNLTGTMSSAERAAELTGKITSTLSYVE